MAIEFNGDKHLIALEDFPDEELDVLVNILITDKEGEKRFSETLTEEWRYEEHYPHHHHYWDLIAAHYQAYSSNTIGRILSGRERTYREILEDVCKIMKVELEEEVFENNTNEYIDVMEKALLNTLFEYFSEMDPDEVFGLIETVDFNTTDIKLLINAVKLAVSAAQGDTEEVAVKSAIILKSISDPAKRVMVPATICIAAMRQKYDSYGAFSDKLYGNKKLNVDPSKTKYIKKGDHIHLFGTIAEEAFSLAEQDDFVVKMMNERTGKISSEICVVGDADSLLVFEEMVKSEELYDVLLIVPDDMILMSNSVHNTLYTSRQTILPITYKKAKKSKDNINVQSLLAEIIVKLSWVIDEDKNDHLTTGNDLLFYLFQTFGISESGDMLFYRDLGNFDVDDIKKTKQIIKNYKVPSDMILFVIGCKTVKEGKTLLQEIMKLTQGREAEIQYIAQHTPNATENTVSVFSRYTDVWWN